MQPLTLPLFLFLSLYLSLRVCVFVPLYYWLISLYCKYAALQLFANLTINNICNFSIVWLLLYDLLFFACFSYFSPPSTPLQTFLISKLKQQTTLSPFVTTLCPKKNKRNLRQISKCPRQTNDTKKKHTHDELREIQRRVDALTEKKTKKLFILLSWQFNSWKTSINEFYSHFARIASCYRIIAYISAQHLNAQTAWVFFCIQNIAYFLAQFKHYEFSRVWAK